MSISITSPFQWETIFTLPPPFVLSIISPSGVSVNEVIFLFLSLTVIRMNKWTLAQEGFTGPIL